MMDPNFEAVWHDYETRRLKEQHLWNELEPDQREGRLDEFLLAAGPVTARFLNLLVRESDARSILELGTSYGYTTLWLADAARSTGGRLTSVDQHQDKLSYAASALDRAGLGEYADLRLGDGPVIAAASGPWDLVFLDLRKDLYVECLDRCLPRLTPGALVVADNMTEPANVRLEALRYRKHALAVPGLDSVLLPVGSGLLVSRYRTP